MNEVNIIKLDTFTEFECGNCGFTYTDYDEADKCCQIKMEEFEEDTHSDYV